MDAVESIEAKARRMEATKTAEAVTIKIRSLFRCDDEWVTHWVPLFKATLVGDEVEPRLTAHQINQGFTDLMMRYKAKTPPAPAHIWDIAKDYLEKPKPVTERYRTLQEPEPRTPRQPIDRERVKELMRRSFDIIDTGRRICMEHGYGTPEAKRLLDEQRRDFESWWTAEQANMRGEF